MKRPGPNASRAAWAQYREWVREQLKDWDPADDRGSPTDYVPRNNGIFASEIEHVESPFGHTRAVRLPRKSDPAD